MHALHSKNTMPVAVADQSAVMVPDSRSGFQDFLFRIHQAPMLSAEEEHELAVRYKRQQDVEAAHRLVFSHMRLVVKIAREYQGYRLGLPDLVQEGAIGLMRAVKRFDPYRGVRLATYAMWWIRATLHDFILQAWSMVKIGTTQIKRRLFFKLRQAKEDMAFLTYDEAVELAERFGTDPETILEMDSRLSQLDLSLNQPAVEGGGELLELTPDQRPGPEDQALAREHTVVLHTLLQQALAELDPREREIVRQRHMAETPVTLEALGETLGISRERVRQLEKRAMGKLRAFMATTPHARELTAAMA